jgi:shikimate dehydrogenase
MALLDEVSPDAALIGAVNTVRRDGDRLIGENTDGKGFLRGVREAGFDPRGKSIVVLGAGGAARAITVELALAGAARLNVVNRNVARGQALVDHLNARTSAQARFIAWDKPYRVDDTLDVVVNATSIGLYPDVDATPDVDLSAARSGVLICDVIPNPPDTRLMQAARARGFKTLNGLSMLVYQGTLGFEMWTGQPAPETVMKAALEKAFAV